MVRVGDLVLAKAGQETVSDPKGFDGRMQVSVFTGPILTDKDLVYRNALLPLALWKVVAIGTAGGHKSATAYIRRRN